MRRLYQKPTDLMKLHTAAALALLLSVTTGLLRAQEPVKLDLVADVTGVQPGATFFVAVRYQIEPGWHTYWINPGDVGVGSTVSWDVPPGFEVGATQYPAPHFAAGPPVSHTYTGTIYHSVAITAPADLKPGDNVDISAGAHWMACKDVCTAPTTTNVKLSLPVVESAEPAAAAELIATAVGRSQDAVPRYQVDASVSDGVLELVALFEDGVSPTADGSHFFAADGDFIDNSAPQDITIDDGFATLKLKLSKPDALQPEVIEGFLVTSSTTLWLTTAKVAQAAGSSSATAATESLGDGDPQLAAIKEMRSWGLVSLDGAEAVPPKSRPFLLVIGLAFLGGMILNLMPCVFPVLGIKILGFVNQAGEDKGEIKKHGLVFAAGVLVSLWVLVAVLFAVSYAAGSHTNWGSQLQNPYFVFAMVAIMYLFGLNLAGLFEFGTSLTGAGTGLQNKKGLGGSFFSGTLAVLIATPCTGPFMAGALSYALSSPIYVSLLVFTSLGLGLSLPYVLLSFYPGLVQKLPRPGPWMETFKQFMAFPMFVTVVWLLHVFSGLTGRTAATFLLLALVIGAFGLWAYGRFGSPVAKKGMRVFAKTAGLVGVGLMIAIGAKASSMIDPDSGGEHVVHKGITWERFDPVKIVEHRKKGRTVFIDFTADW